MEYLQQFYQEEIPYSKLEKFGITYDMLTALPGNVYDRLLSGQVSPKISVKVPTAKGTYEVPVKLQLQRTDNGDAEVFFLPTYDKSKTDYSIEIMGGFTREERESLEKGNIIVAYMQIPSPDGTLNPVRSFVQLDKDMQQVLHIPTQVIGRNIKAAASKFNLRTSEIDALLEGKRVTFPYVNGDVTIGVDFGSEYGLLSVKGDETDWLRLANSSLPEYSFGETGCWVSTADGLKFVEEKDFTEDIKAQLVPKPAEQSTIEATEKETVEAQEQIDEGRAENQGMQR